MAKIRGIKPDTWTDEKFVSVPPLARLLFIGMWNYCCDNGHVEGSPLQLKMRILPVDNCDVAELIEALIEQGLVVRIGGYLKVPNLPLHQRPDKRFLTFCAQCEHDENLAYTIENPKARPASTPRAHVENTTSTPRAHVDDCECDGECDGDTTPRPTVADATLELVEAEVAEAEIVEPDMLPVPAVADPFETWWAIYDKKVGKRKAKQKWAVALKKPGVTAELLIRAAEKYVNNQKSINKHPQFTKNPETWLNSESWNDDLVPTSVGRVPVGRPTRDDWDAAMARAAAKDAEAERNAS